MAWCLQSNLAGTQTPVCTGTPHNTCAHKAQAYRLTLRQQGTTQGKLCKRAVLLTWLMPPWAPISLSSEEVVVVPHVPVEQVLALALPADREPPATEKTSVPAAKYQSSYLLVKQHNKIEVSIITDAQKAKLSL